jgi:four helix bundle protein
MTKKKIEKYEDLRIWQYAHELVLRIYQISSSFPKSEIYGITSQIRRASASVTANIVEGYYRNSRKEFVQFLYMARGSAGEVTSFLHIAKDLKYISEKDYNELRNKYERLLASISALIKSLNDEK